jgi:hypothetical protein
MSFRTPLGCITTKTLTVAPTAPVTGAAAVCMGATIDMSDAVAGGTWASTNYGAATITNAGVLKGLLGGVTMIHYTLPITGCVESATVTVNNCGRTADSTDTATSVQTVAIGDDIQLFPNPNKGSFTIKGTLSTQEDEEAAIEITDMLGQVIYQNKILTQGGNINEQIQLSRSLANGMYIVSLRSATDNKVFHVVIEE